MQYVGAQNEERNLVENQTINTYHVNVTVVIDFLHDCTFISVFKSFNFALVFNALYLNVTEQKC